MVASRAKALTVWVSAASARRGWPQLATLTEAQATARALPEVAEVEIWETHPPCPFPLKAVSPFWCSRMVEGALSVELALARVRVRTWWVWVARAQLWQQRRCDGLIPAARAIPSGPWGAPAFPARPVRAVTPRRQIPGAACQWPRPWRQPPPFQRVHPSDSAACDGHDVAASRRVPHHADHSPHQRCPSLRTLDCCVLSRWGARRRARRWASAASMASGRCSSK